MILKKQKVYKLTVETSGSTRNNMRGTMFLHERDDVPRLKGNIMRGTIIIVGTVLEYFVISSII